jgi:hypothetical protein
MSSSFKFNSGSNNNYLQQQQCAPGWIEHNKLLELNNGLQDKMNELNNEHRRSENALIQIYQRINRIEFMQNIGNKNPDSFDVNHFINYLYTQFQEEKLPFSNVVLNFAWIRQIRYFKVTLFVKFNYLSTLQGVSESKLKFISSTPCHDRFPKYVRKHVRHSA